MALASIEYQRAPTTNGRLYAKRRKAAREAASILHHISLMAHWLSDPRLAHERSPETISGTVAIILSESEACRDQLAEVFGIQLFAPDDRSRGTTRG